MNLTNSIVSSRCFDLIKYLILIEYVAVFERIFIMELS